MASTFYVVVSVSLVFTILFIAITANPSPARTSNTFYLKSGEIARWYYNSSEIINGNWKMTTLVSVTDRSLAYYCGFYSYNGADQGSFSIVAVEKYSGNEDVVWSANGLLIPLQVNSFAELSHRGLTLWHSDRTRIWSAYPEALYMNRTLMGMNLTEEGNFILFDSNGDILWQSFDNPTDTLLVGQRLYRGKTLSSLRSSATITESANFSVFTNTTDGRCLIYYQLPLDKNHPSGLHYEKQYGTEYVVNKGTSQRSYPLEFIEFVKLNEDGYLRTYRFESWDRGIVVDVFTQECNTSLQDRYRLTQVWSDMYFNTANTDEPLKSRTTLSGCQQVCLKNCSCTAILFSYGKCYISSDIFSIGDYRIYEAISVKYIKVISVLEALVPPGGVPYYPRHETKANVLPPTPSPNPFPPPGEDIPDYVPLNPTLIPLPSRHRKNLALIISMPTVGGIIFIFLILASIVMFRKNRLETDGEDNINKMVHGLMPRKFSYEELEIATDNFNVTLGTGGFGTVFKGELIDYTEIAVKRLDKISEGMKEFLAEVETIGRLHHFNLVRLVGYCAEKSSRLLVYEYMSNGSLDKWIFSINPEHFLDWQTRKKILLGIAKGLAYLHEDCLQKIIHLDIKPHNILLDDNFNAKVSDFGLSKLIGRDENQVLTTMRGTPGYLAPELQHSTVTVKVDVYSFGIVLLEIVCKRRNVESSRSESSFHLLKMLQKRAKEDRLIDIVEDLDEDMRNNEEDVTRTIRIGAWCLQNDHDKRPLMSTVVKVLEGVMEVDTTISYEFSHAMTFSAAANGNITVPPQASTLSAPR